MAAEILAAGVGERLPPNMVRYSILELQLVALAPAILSARVAIVGQESVAHSDSNSRRLTLSYSRSAGWYKSLALEYIGNLPQERPG